jgi:hypothetical protein
MTAQESRPTEISAGCSRRKEDEPRRDAENEIRGGKKKLRCFCDNNFICKEHFMGRLRFVRQERDGAGTLVHEMTEGRGGIR